MRLRRGPCQPGSQCGLGVSCPGGGGSGGSGGSNENFKPVKVVFPTAAECRRQSAYGRTRTDRRTAPLLARAPIRSRTRTPKSERARASERGAAALSEQWRPPLAPRAPAVVTKLTKPSIQRKSCEDFLKGEKETREHGQASSARRSGGSGGGTRHLAETKAFFRLESIPNLYGKDTNHLSIQIFQQNLKQFQE